MNPLWWVAWSGICAIGSGLLIYFVMQSRMEVRLSKQREQLATAKAQLAAQKESLEQTIAATQDSTRRQAFDEFLAEIRVEERHYVREHKALFVTRKSMVRQERIFFRNIPLTDWVEHEMPIEEGADVDKLLKTMSVFEPLVTLDPAEDRVRKLLR